MERQSGVKKGWGKCNEREVKEKEERREEQIAINEKQREIENSEREGKIAITERNSQRKRREIERGKSTIKERLKRKHEENRWTKEEKITKARREKKVQ